VRELGDRRRFNAEADCLAACEKLHIARPAASWRAAAFSLFIPGRGVPVASSGGAENSSS